MMFENFYTTKMSMGKKCIEERFEKMRRKTGNTSTASRGVKCIPR